MSTNYSPEIVTDGAVFVGDARMPSISEPGTRVYNRAGVDSADVKLLVHGNVGSSQSFADSSLSNHAITAYGNVTHSTTDTKFTGGSIYFDGVDDYLTIPASGDWDVGTGDWTFDCWVRPTTSSSAAYVFETRSASYTGNFSLYRNGLYLVYYAQSTSIISTSSVLTVNGWSHVALVRSGSTVTIYVDGLSAGSGTDANDYQGLAPFTIGTRHTGTGDWTGYMDEIRFTKGVALWTQAFTPPARRDTLSISDGMMYNGTCAEFDGTNDYVDTGSTFQSTFRNSFSFSTWVRSNDGQEAGLPKLMGMRNSTYQDWIHVGFDVGKLEMYYASNAAGKYGETASAVLGAGVTAWHHVVAVADEGAAQMYLYFDGVLQTLGAGSVDGDLTGIDFSLFTTTDNLYLAARNKFSSTSEENLNGSMADARLYNCALSAAQVKEIYDNSKVIIPSNVPQTNLAALWTLAEGSGDILYDGSGNGNNGTFENEDGDEWLTGQTGCPQLVEGYNRPMLFDGVNDYVGCSAYDFGSAVTVSLWAFYGSQLVSGWQDALITQDDGTNRFMQLSNHGTVIAWHRFGASGGDLFSTTAPIKGNWYHIVVTAGGGTQTMYVNGSAEDTLSGTFTGSASEPIDIGRKGSAEAWSYFDGIINEVILYDTALSSAEVQALYATDVNGGPLPPDPTTLSTGGNIVSYWRNDGEETWRDRVGSNTGTVNGSPSVLLFKQGINGSASTSTGRDNQGFPLLCKNVGAVGFGGSDYISIAGLPALTTKTVAFWTQIGAGVFTGTADNVVVGLGSGWAGLDMVDDGGDTASLRFHNSAGSNPGSARITGLETNQWYYLVYTEDGTTNKYYKNGILIDSTAAGTTTSATTIAVGARTGLDYNYSGAVSGLQLYSRALSQAEIAQNYKAQRSRFT